jgi:hypothetical protein
MRKFKRHPSAALKKEAERFKFDLPVEVQFAEIMGAAADRQRSADRWLPFAEAEMRIEERRSELKADRSKIQHEDRGPGSPSSVRLPGTIYTHTTTISSLVRASQRRVWCRLLFGFGYEFGITDGLELGTSLGIGSSYVLWGMGPGGILRSVEYSPRVADKGAETVKKTDAPGRFIGYTCSFDRFFNDRSDEITGRRAIVVVDGDHRGPSTIRYFRKINGLIPSGIIFFDDIRWNDSMEKGWNRIVSESSHDGWRSVDLDSVGFLYRGV